MIPHNKKRYRLSLIQLRDLILLIVIVFACGLPGINTLPVTDRDEARYIQATRQMIETGDYVEIRFQETPRNKKPAGIYWLQAASVWIVLQCNPEQQGNDDTSYSPKNINLPIWAFRIPSIVGALFSVCAIYLFGSALFNRRTALLGSVLLATSLLLIVESHLAKTDAMLLATVCVSQGILGIIYCRSRDTRRRNRWRDEKSLVSDKISGFGIAIVFWVAIGVGILIKGPMTPMLCAVTVVTLIVIDRNIGWLKQLRFLIFGTPIVILIVAPWAIAVHIQTGGAFWRDAWSGDLLPKLVSSEESHGMFPGFYTMLLVVTFWPGSLFAGLALRRAFRKSIRLRSAERFCLAWLLPMWIILECIPTKLPHYVLPLYPALALITARGIISATAVVRHNISCQESWFAIRGNAPGAKIGYVLWWCITLCFGVGIVAIAVVFRDNGIQGFYVPPIAPLVGILFVIISLLTVTLAWYRNYYAATILSALGSIVVFAITFALVLPNATSAWLSNQIELEYQSIVEDNNNASLSIVNNMPQILSVGYHEPSLVFLIGTDIILTSPIKAAELLIKSEPGTTIVIITEDAEPEFLDYYTNQTNDYEVVRLGHTVFGYNYTKGNWLTMHYFVKKGRSSIE